MKRNDIQAKRRGRRPSDVARRWFRPTLETLGDRIMPSITVNTLADTFDGSITDGTISLRDAIAAAPAGGTIDFSVTGTIVLALGPMVVQDRIIDGPGAANLTIEAPVGSGESVFITSGTTTISGLTITGGDAVFGGGIRNEGGESDLTVVDSVITGNVARRGGGIYGGGYLGAYNRVKVLNSTLSYNQAVDPIGISSFYYGRGGGIDGKYTTVTIDKSTISGNSASNLGGGIYAGDVEMTDSTVSVNEASFFRAGHGAGVYAFTGTIANSTISGNFGDGLHAGDVVVANSTITTNSYGVISDGTTTLLNSIVAGNFGRDISIGTINIGTINASDSRNNLIGNAGSAGGLVNGVNGNIVGVLDPGLGPLADNGGPTLTCALYSFSPAVNAGDNALVPIDPSTGLPYTTDQNGASRISGGMVDMGAVEVQGTVVPSTVVNTTTDDVAGNDLTSLREAIGFASRSGGAVTFDPAVFATPQTITLVHGPIIVDGRAVPVTITGPGSDLTTVDAGGAPSVFITHGTTSISGLTLTGAGPRGSDVQVMSWGDGSTVPTSGLNLLIAGTDSNGLLHIRTFDFEGHYVDATEVMEGGTLHFVTVNGDSLESNLVGSQAQAFAQLKQQLPGLLPPHVLTQVEKAQVIEEATLIIDAEPDVVKGAIDNEAGALTVQDSQIANNETRGIFNKDTLTVVNSIISGNQGPAGSGIYSEYGGLTILTISNSIIDGNSTPLSRTRMSYGGGIYCSGTTTISSSTISNNSSYTGGGIYCSGTTTISSSTISNNSSTNGGGIFDNGTATVVNSIISGNSARNGGGGFSRRNGALTVVNSTVSGNSAGVAGGGIFGDGVTVLNSTISGNSAVLSGGGIFGDGVTVLNSTISGNSAGKKGGGIWAGTGCMIWNSTIANNTASGSGGGGLYDLGSTVFNSIIAGNLYRGQPNDVLSEVSKTNGILLLNAASAHNLIGDAASAGGLVNGVNGNIVGVDPALVFGPLADNGGPTPTMALLPGSPAIDAGSNSLIPIATTMPFAFDQRGFSRVVGGTVDIGAYEAQGFVLTASGGNNQTTGVNTAFANPLVVTVTAADGVDPVAGGHLTFTTPTSGASATLSPANPVTIASDGTATVNVSANGNGGTYQVTAIATGVATPVAFALTNLVAQTITVTPYDVPYDGNAHTATGTATGQGGVDLSADLTLTGTTHTNAGTYTDTWTFHDPTGVYPDASGTVSDSISAVSANPSVTGYNGVPYKGTPYTATASATDVNGNPLPVSDFVLTNTTHTNAGSYTDAWSFHDPSGNYLDASGTVSDSIAAAMPQVNVSDASGTYTGSPFAATASVAGVVAGVDSTPAAQLEGVAPTLTYYVGTFTLTSLPTTGGSSTAPTSTGNYTVLAFFPGSADYTAASATTTFTVSPAATKTSTVGLSSTTAVYGQPVTLTVTVSNTQTAVIPSGSVGFYNGATELGTAPVGAGGTASLTVAKLAMGKHAITALFSDPEIDFAPSGSPSAVSLTISKDTTTTALTAATTATVFGQAVTFTATVTADAPSMATPTGSVTFRDGSTVLQTVSLNGGRASFTTAKLAVGSHSITASYNGTGNLATSSSAASAVSVGLDVSTAAVTASVSNPVYGQTVTLKATVTAAPPGSGKPTGTVSFYDGTTLLGTATLSSGTASIKTTALVVGGNSVTVMYGGDSNFTGTTSAPRAITVNQDFTTTKLTSSSATAAHGTPVTFTATVLPAFPGTGTPTGTVSFWDGSTLLGTANLSGGVAQQTFSFSVTGKHKIKAVYNGDADFLSSTSALLTETIT